jgi:hypothetical protein
MVRFFGVLSSLAGCLPLSMALGFSLLEQGRRCEVMEECASGFAGHPRGLFYWLRERIGSDDWLACVIGIPSGRVFLPNAKGFHWTVLMDSRIEDFLRVLCQGAFIFTCSARAKFPNAFKKNKARSCKHKGISTIQAWKLKFFIYCRRSNIPSTI